MSGILLEMSERTVLAGTTILTSLEILTLGAAELFAEELDCDQCSQNNRRNGRHGHNSIAGQAAIVESYMQNVRDEASQKDGPDNHKGEQLRGLSMISQCPPYWSGCG
jgi:hypothetical protein